jgi:hypothetical protein
MAYCEKHGDYSVFCTHCDYELLERGVETRPNKGHQTMITVTIFINGSPILTRSATREQLALTDEKFHYDVDTGETVLHNPHDGAVELAKKLLNTIHEPGRRRKSKY